MKPFFIKRRNRNLGRKKYRRDIRERRLKN